MGRRICGSDCLDIHPINGSELFNARARMDDNPVPKALIDTMDDLDDFKALLEALHTLQLV